MKCSYGDVLGDKGTMYEHYGDRKMRVLDCIVTISCGCVLCCGCFNWFCNVWVCVYVWILLCVDVCLCGFCNVWVCVCVDLVMCGCVYVWIL